MTDTTFRKLDGGKQTERGDAPLDRWYASVSELPLGKLPLADLMRALRQEIHLRETAAEAITRAEKDPHAGDAYPDELITALASVNEAFWRDERGLCKRAAALRLQLAEIDEDEREAIGSWRRLVTLLARSTAVLRAGDDKNGFELSALEETTAGSSVRETIQRPALGRRHFVIRPEDDGFVLYAQGDPLMVNGKDVERHVLRSGDRIEAGSVGFVFEERA